MTSSRRATAAPLRLPSRERPRGPVPGLRVDDRLVLRVVELLAGADLPDVDRVPKEAADLSLSPSRLPGRGRNPVLVKSLRDGPHRAPAYKLGEDAPDDLRLRLDDRQRAVLAPV